MNCKVCGAEKLNFLWPDNLDSAQTWHRCRECKSDSSTGTYAAIADLYATINYRDHFYSSHPESLANALKQVTANVEWFNDYAPTVRGRDFLDVGHCDGAMLTRMQESGWRVHGFDVNPTADYGPHVTIAPKFRADLFPQQYDAVNCREVIEHIEDWREFLDELFKATKTGGLCQVQTPKPIGFIHPDIYQKFHLQIFSVPALADAVRQAGFVILDKWEWGIGQAVLLRKP